MSSLVTKGTTRRRIVARVGSKPIEILQGVQVLVGDDNEVTVKGSLGTLVQRFHPDMLIDREDGYIKIQRPSDQRQFRALQGLTRSLLNNMIIGVSTGYEKSLDLVGTGYRAQQVESGLTLQLGFSHPVDFEPPDGITLTAESPTRIIISGCDKQQVGQMAASIRASRPPDAYKGKGVRYVGEQVKLKPGKSASKG